MKFSTKEDIEAPLDHVFGRIADFDGLERSALRRGAEIRRIDALEVPGTGSIWDIGFTFRGKPREVRATLTSFDPGQGYTADLVSRTMDGVIAVDLVALSRNRTRLSVTLEVQPKTLAARLMVQSIKLAKANMTRRFRTRVADFAEDIEEKYRAGA